MTTAGAQPRLHKTAGLPLGRHPAVEAKKKASSSLVARAPQIGPKIQRVTSSLPVVREARARGSALTAYMQDAGRYLVMSREEEHEIALRYWETRNEKLGKCLVTANLRLVMKMAGEHRAARKNLDDLVQEGNIGLLHAVWKYNPHRGVKLSTYAVWWIRAYMWKFILANARLVKLGTTPAQRRVFFGLRRARALLGQNGAEVQTYQLAEALSVSERELVEMEQRLSSADASLDARTRDDEERVFGDMLSAEPALGPDLQSERREFGAAFNRELQTFRQTLNGRELVLFEKRICCEKARTLAEIGRKFGVSRERARQIEKRLKERLRAHLRAALGDAVPAAA